MEWTKVKNIILLILLMVNVILLIMVGQRELESAHLQETARAQSVAVLEASGISVEASLPPDRSLSALQVGWERSAEQETTQVEALLGEGAVREPAPGGIRVQYRGAKGTAEISGSGPFLFELEENAWVVGDEGVVNHGIVCLKRLDFDAEWVSTTQEGETTVITYRQCWDGVPVFNCQVDLTYENGVLRQIEGKRRLQGATTAVGAAQKLSVPTALTRLLAGLSEGGSVSSKLISLTAGYEASSTSRASRLTPVWFIVTDTSAYCMDGATGTLTRQEIGGA